jgi:hypothetical protein
LFQYGALKEKRITKTVDSERIKQGRRKGITLEQVTKAQRGSRGLALPFLNLGAKCGWVGNATFRPLNSRERDQVPIV